MRKGSVVRSLRSRQWQSTPKIKPFKATAFHNGKFVAVTDADLKGKWSVVFFYPADFTFVCPTELGDLADHYAEFQKLGVEIYGVSTDTHFTHKAWHDTSETIGKIKYPMIGDPTGTSPATSA
jgi:alkyl hydroperoxide reductase subunit AhpC